MRNRIIDREGLVVDGCVKVFEMVTKDSLLQQHAFRTAGSRTDVAQSFQNHEAEFTGQPLGQRRVVDDDPFATDFKAFGAGVRVAGADLLLLLLPLQLLIRLLLAIFLLPLSVTGRR